MSGLIEESRKVHRYLTAEQKLSIVKASYEPGVHVSEVARKYNVGVSSLIKWRKQSLEGSLINMKDDAPAIPASEVKKLKKEIAQLQKLLGKKSLQIE